MATAVKVVLDLPVHARTIPLTVGIYADPTTKQISAEPDPFWISLRGREEVVWVCKREHVHGDDKCFTVDFGDDSPFPESVFKDHGVRSGHPKAHVIKEMLYKYTVTVPGVGCVDPQGGVKD